jgi:hypothetical protein
MGMNKGTRKEDETKKKCRNIMAKSGVKITQIFD